MPGEAHCPSEATAVDTLFDTLSHHVRREVIRYFEQEVEDDTATLRELVVTVSEQTTQVESQRTQLSLEQVHLPKLADAGFISWDHETGVVTRGPRFDEVRPLIELLDRHADGLPANWP